jgi:hypothetical protein
MSRCEEYAIYSEHDVCTNGPIEYILRQIGRYVSTVYAMKKRGSIVLLLPYAYCSIAR